MTTTDGTEKPPKTKAHLARERIRRAVAFAYDLQRMRLACANRARGHEEEAPGAEIQIDDDEKKFLGSMSEGIDKLEKQAFGQVKKQLAGIPIYEEWLTKQKGVGPAMAGVLLSSFDIEREDNPSKMWAFAGLHTVCSVCRSKRCTCATPQPHVAPRPQKGEKLPYNAWLRSKLVKVLAECLLRANSPWRAAYDGKRKRRLAQVGPCMLCPDSKGVLEKKPCYNCAGTGRAPWGRSDAHRHNDAKRFMVKMFLLAFWTEWRTREGLAIREPYYVEKLGMPAHGSSSVTKPEGATDISEAEEAEIEEELKKAVG